MVSYERLSSTILACHYVIQNDIPGDFVECGVWRGGNALAAASIFQRCCSDRKVWLFDTFQGMTFPTEHDVQISDGKLAGPQHRASQKMDHNDWAYAKLDDVKQHLLKVMWVKLFVMRIRYSRIRLQYFG